MAGYIGSTAVSLSTTAANVDGNITVTGNVDGRDVSVDGTKLDTIPIISTSSVASFTAKGDGSSQDGYIQLNCYQNTHGIKLKSPPHSAGASYTLVFPVNDGDSGQFLRTDGSGVLSWGTDATLDNTKLPLAGGAMTGNVTYGDNNKIILGASSDLNIYHDSTQGANVIGGGTSSNLTITSGGNLSLGIAQAELLMVGTVATLSGNTQVKLSSGVVTTLTGTGGVTLDNNGNPKFSTTNTGVAVTGNITVTGTVDSIDIATRDAVLTSTTTTANAALPKAGGAMTGAITTNSTFDGRDVAADGVLATNALPKSGGAMTGAITTNSTFDGRDVAADGVLATNALPKSGGAVTGNVTFGDGNKAIFGTGSDLQIFHDGTNSFSAISDQGTGPLVILSNNLLVQNAGGTENMIKALDGGAVELYNNNIKALETTTTGVQVTGLINIASLGGANPFITASGHNVFQTDSNVTYFYGGGGGVSFRTADNSAALINITNAGILSTVTPGTSNFRMGVNAGDNILSGGNQNVAIGDYAGTAITTGDGNTALGYNALASEDTGNQNTAIGYTALANANKNNTNLNTAVGASAGQQLTTGYLNTFLGGEAGLYATTADSSTFVGVHAGLGITGAKLTGNDNTAVGRGAGRYLQGVARNNTAIGGQALYNNTVALGSTAVGYQSLYTQSTAGTGSNTALGYQAGYTTNSYYNTFLGSLAGKLSTGIQNTFVGHGCANLMTTGTKNTILGCYTGNYGGLDIRTSSNHIVLSDGDGNPRFFIKSNGLPYAPAAYSTTTSSSANMYIQSDGAFYRSTSSRRYKNTIEDATYGLTELLTLRPVTYKGNNDGDTVFGGLIAEEVHDAGLTEFVQYNDDGEPDAIAYGQMVSLCIKAIKEQQATITALTARITTLEG